LPAAVAADRPNEEPEQRRQWLTEDEVEKIIKHNTPPVSVAS
jgi:hypothetical protein